MAYTFPEGNESPFEWLLALGAVAGTRTGTDEAVMAVVVVDSDSNASTNGNGNGLIAGGRTTEK